MRDATQDHRSTPGLLPWQLPVCALALGLLAMRFPEPAAVGFGLFLLISRPAWPSVRWAVACAACFVVGFGWAQAAMPPLPAEHPQWMLEREVAEVSGRVARVTSAPGRQLRVFIDDARFELDDGREGELPGEFLWVWIRPEARPHPGQSVTVRTRVRPVRGFANPGTWDTRFYWGRQGVFYRGYSRGNRGAPVLGDEAPGIGARIRASLLDAVERAAPDTNGRALLAALVLGERFFVDRDVYDTVRRSSLAHSLALSGLHLGFAAGLGFGLAWLIGWLRPGVLLRIPRLKLGALLAAPLVVAYMWLGGATPSLLRAGIMFASWGALLMADRGRVLLDGLLFAVLVILCLDPLAVYDVRLQFSAVAVAGIALWMPLLWPLVPWKETARRGGVVGAAATAARALVGTLCVSLCATFALLPLSVWNFGEVGLSLYLNMLWLPVLGLFAVPVGLVGLVFSSLPGLDGFGQWLLGVDATVLDHAVGALLGMDAGGLLPVAVPMRPLWPHLVGWFASLVGAMVWLRTRSRSALAGMVLAVGLMAWPAVWAVASGERNGVALTVLDAGQSQAVLIDCPGGGRVLVDAGGGWKGGIDTGRAVVVPALTRGRWPVLDLAVLSHPDADHYRGLLHTLSVVPVDEFAFGGRWPRGEEGARLREILEREGIPVREVSAGDAFALGDGLALEVVHSSPPDAPLSNNDASLVLRLVWNGRGLALLPGDIEEKGLAGLLARDVDLGSDVLLLPHHGSETSLSFPLYQRVAPRLALAATGFINYLGFPSRAVRESLGPRGVPVYATGDCGAVRVRWNAPEAPPRIQTALDCGD